MKITEEMVGRGKAWLADLPTPLTKSAIDVEAMLTAALSGEPEAQPVAWMASGALAALVAQVVDRVIVERRERRPEYTIPLYVLDPEIKRIISESIPRPSGEGA